MAKGLESGRTTRVSRVIIAPREALYEAWLDANSIASWLPPKGMRGKVHEFVPREGGTYRLSLTYERSDHSAPGKTSADTDAVRGHFVDLIPYERIVQAVEFDSNEPEFAGEMTMTITFADTSEGTVVTVLCENIPRGIRLEDNEAGCGSTLENLAAFLA